jgi:hypothetical protein
MPSFKEANGEHVAQSVALPIWGPSNVVAVSYVYGLLLLLCYAHASSRQAGLTEVEAETRTRHMQNIESGTPRPKIRSKE